MPRFVRAISLGVVSLAVLATAVVAESQKVYRVGTLFPRIVHESFRMEGLRQALRERGYVEGRNLVLESRLTDDDNFFRPDLAEQLVRMKVDVIVTIEIAGGQAARHATRTIPIVVLNCDPHQELTASLARPGGNVTGQSCMNSETTPKKLEWLKLAVPHLSRLAFLYNPRQPGPVLGLKLAQDSARSLGVSLRPVEVTAPADFEPAFGVIVRERLDGLFVYHDFVTARHRPQIIEFAGRTRLPAMYAYRDWVDMGGLMSYGPDLREMYVRAGRQIAHILSGGRPGDLPVEQPTTFELVINTKTAKAAGFNVPEALLLRADRVVE